VQSRRRTPWHKHTHTAHSKMHGGVVVDVAGELHLSNARGSGESVSSGEEWSKASHRHLRTWRGVAPATTVSSCAFSSTSQPIPPPLIKNFEPNHTTLRLEVGARPLLSLCPRTLPLMHARPLQCMHDSTSCLPGAQPMRMCPQSGHAKLVDGHISDVPNRTFQTFHSHAKALGNTGHDVISTSGYRGGGSGRGFRIGCRAWRAGEYLADGVQRRAPRRRSGAVGGGVGSHASKENDARFDSAQALS
jgi:hypothetical protein